MCGKGCALTFNSSCVGVGVEASGLRRSRGEVDREVLSST